MAWTEQMVEDLKKMWKEGLTTGEIGRRLNVSKNSIVGKVHRLGLSGRPSPIKRKDSSDNSKPAKTPVTATKPAEKAAKAPAPKPIKEQPPKEKAPKIETPVQIKEAEIKYTPAIKAETTPCDPENMSLTDLDNHTCRWPLGDPKDENFHFCGKKVRIGQTYCDEHAAVAYVKPNKK